VKHRRLKRWKPDWPLRLLGGAGFTYLLLRLIWSGEESITYMLACLTLMGVANVLPGRKDDEDE
jgi:hypothetical protein